MKILLIGSTGMLGQALYKKFTCEKVNLITVARNHSDYKLNLLYESNKIIDIIKYENPDVVINCAAIINLKYCEQNPSEAFTINARLPGLISLACQSTNSYFIQISTDHYYIDHGKKQHTEMDKVTLLNEYAQTKYNGEVFALYYKKTLVIRTNIVGYRDRSLSPTFVEWIINTLKAKEPIVGFEDYYTSSIDIYSFSGILKELIHNQVEGILNIASNDVISKYEFIYTFAQSLGLQKYVNKGKQNNDLEIKRANSLGLNVSRLSNYLEYQSIPTSSQVIKNLVRKYKEGAYNELQ